MMPFLLGIPLAALVLWILYKCRKRNVFLWIPSYVKGDWAGRREANRISGTGPTHILFCIADHYEPAVKNPGIAVERERVEHWLRRYPELFERFRDADGRPPRHTFFYPAEQYNGEHLDRLGELVRAGYGEVEVHLHHDRDTSAGMRDTLLNFVRQLRSHGYLGGHDPDGEAKFGFVHGNWALGNSMPDGSWCGVSDELSVLADCGCYADFTLPSAPSPTQTRRINSIYYAKNVRTRRRSQENGTEVKVGSTARGGLMIIQGPLSLARRPGKILPRVENGSLDGVTPITAQRVASWIRARVCVAGRPEWIFVKLYTHGCLERNWKVLFGEPMLTLHSHLAERYNDGSRHVLHYVTAREMYNIVRAAERGLSGNPGEYRDFEISAPPCMASPVRGRLARVGGSG